MAVLPVISVLNRAMSSVAWHDAGDIWRMENKRLCQNNNSSDYIVWSMVSSFYPRVFELNWIYKVRILQRQANVWHFDNFYCKLCATPATCKSTAAETAAIFCQAVVNDWRSFVPPQPDVVVSSLSLPSSC